MQPLFEWTSFAADVVQILLGLIAIIISVTQRKKISAAFSILFTHSLRASVSDFRHQLEKLKECKMDDDGAVSAREAMSHIAGKISGNDVLLKHLGSKILKRVKGYIQDLDDGKAVLDSTKTQLYSEIKERLDSLEVNQVAHNPSKND